MSVEKELAFIRRYEGKDDYQLTPIAIDEILIHNPDSISLIRNGKPKSRRAAKKLAAQYLSLLDRYLTLGLKDAYTAAPTSIKHALKDTAYNIGPATTIATVRDALADRDYKKMSLALLDTATINGKASAGLAKRRAELHNKILKELARRRIDSYSGKLRKAVRNIYEQYQIQPNLITTIRVKGKELQYINKFGGPVHVLRKPTVKHSREEYRVPNSVT